MERRDYGRSGRQVRPREVYVLNREQVQRLVFPEDAHGRITRRRLQSLVDAHLLSRQAMLVCHPANGVPAPVYYPSRSGAELLAEMTGDDRLLAISSQAPSMHHVWHWLAVSETHIAFDQAMALQSEATLVDWFNEYDVVNPGESTMFRCLLQIQEEARRQDGLDYLQVFEDQGTHEELWFIEDGEGGAITALLPDDY